MKKEKKLNHPSVYRIISIIIIAILAVLFTFPLYWIITGSFKTNAAINSTTPIWWPQEWTLANYQKLFSRQTAPLFQFTILQQPVYRQQRLETGCIRSLCTRCNPLVNQHCGNGCTVHDSYLYHCCHGWIRSGKEKIRRTSVPVHHDCMCNGFTETGYLSPPAA